MKLRLGQFFLLIGLILLILFFFTEGGQNPRPLLLLGGLASTVFGISLIWRSRAPAAPSERFRTVRKTFQKKK